MTPWIIAVLIALLVPVGDAPPTRSERLAALSPKSPIAYLELAEDIAAEPLGLDDRDLARRLYVLAVFAGQSSPAGAEWVPASACLGLAALADGERERRWLSALAGVLAPADARLAVEQQNRAAALDTSALDLASALGLLRAGEGRRAVKLLDKPGVGTLLDRYERVLSADGAPGGAAKVRALLTKAQPCPECRNRRHIKDKDGVRLCPSCAGLPGPRLDEEELVGQLRLESLLLNGIQRSWAAQAIADEGEPLRELDPESLADTYGVDPKLLWWRAGRWAADPAAPATAVPR